jgi:hypothetical protein
MAAHMLDSIRYALVTIARHADHFAKHLYADEGCCCINTLG